MENMKGNGIANSIMIKDRTRLTSVLMIITSVLTLIVAGIGVFNSKIYANLLTGVETSNFVVAGSVNQDILAIVCAILLLFISIILFKDISYKKMVFALGLVGYILYGYAVYTFGILLTPLYIVYIAIFTLSVYTVIMGLLSFDSSKVLKTLQLEKKIRISIGAFFIIITLAMTVKWVADILSTALSDTHPELYLIAAMDLGIALPAIGISGVMILKNKSYGIILSGIALIKTLTLSLSVAIGTLIAPFFDVPIEGYGTMVFFSLLTGLSLLLMILLLKGISLDSMKSKKNSLITQ